MHNKPVDIMAADMKTQISVLRKNSSDYPQCSFLETATISIGKTLPAIAARWRVTGARLRHAVRL